MTDGKKVLRIYAAFESPRLHYVLRFLVEEQLGIAYSLTGDAGEEVHLFYGENPLPNSRDRQAHALHFRPDGSLAGSAKAIFQDGADWNKNALPADLFSAVFFLLSRAEEWGIFTPDRHSRFPAAQSLLYKLGLLQTPLIDHWVSLLRKQLNEHLGWNLEGAKFRFQPTYDIDIAYAYLHKGRRRTMGGLLRDLKSGNWREINNRIQVLAGKAQDPFDAFDFMRGQHKSTSPIPHPSSLLPPIYFVLAAQKSGPYDKNISPAHPAMAALTTDFAMQGTVGMHPSYTTSEQPQKMAAEKQWLQSVLEKPVLHSRQHYIRLSFPNTYRQLLTTGITHDWSMGYPDAVGFRAGTSQSFLWYDLERERETHLRIHPFCFMDTTARDYLGWPAEKAGVFLAETALELEALGGTLTTVFHNFSLGRAGDWPGWREVYGEVVRSFESD